MPTVDALPELRFRPIVPGDAPRLADGLRRLSRESIRRRFLAHRERLSTRELRYLTEVDFWRHYALVAVLADDRDELVAVGRWVRTAEDWDTAEVAIVVGDCWQGRGVGRHLGMLLADAARSRGVRRFTASMLPENTAAHRLFRAVSDRLVAVHSGGLDELTAELAA
ncbi:MAG TPA: GNAT family N-acetyltransferase [Capillimicrobium sp.]|nr:GNAT family N-acetyltransferase [Capillimicrobium sp.]